MTGPEVDGATLGAAGAVGIAAGATVGAAEGAGCADIGMGLIELAQFKL